MTVDRITPSSAPRVERASDIVVDGVITGMIGAVIVALWFLVLDLVAGRPLFTPAVLGSVLLHGRGAAGAAITIDPVIVAAYTAFHFVAFVVAGLALAWMVSLFERFPIMFFVILVTFLCLEVGFFAVDVMLGHAFMSSLPAWSVAVANVLAAAGMAVYLWRRHPSVWRGIERLWEHEGPREG
jgi:hypothetical protein